MLKVEPTESGRNGNEAIGNVASVAFARWLYHRYAPSKCHRRRHIVLLRETLFLDLSLARWRVGCFDLRTKMRLRLDAGQLAICSGAKAVMPVSSFLAAQNHANLSVRCSLSAAV